MVSRVVSGPAGPVGRPRRGGSRWPLLGRGPWPLELYTRERRADHRRERGGGRGPSEVRLLA